MPLLPLCKDRSTSTFQALVNGCSWASRITPCITTRALDSRIVMRRLLDLVLLRSKPLKASRLSKWYVKRSSLLAMAYQWTNRIPGCLLILALDIQEVLLYTTRFQPVHLSSTGRSRGIKTPGTALAHMCPDRLPSLHSKQCSNYHIDRLRSLCNERSTVWIAASRAGSRDPLLQSPRPSPWISRARRRAARPLSSEISQQSTPLSLLPIRGIPRLLRVVKVLRVQETSELKHAIQRPIQPTALPHR